MRLWSRVGFQSRVLLPIVVGFSLRGCVGGTVVGLAELGSGLQSLVVRVGGVELGSWLLDAGRAVGGGCVDAPRRTSTLP